MGRTLLVALSLIAVLGCDSRNSPEFRALAAKNVSIQRELSALNKRLELLKNDPACPGPIPVVEPPEDLMNWLRTHSNYVGKDASGADLWERGELAKDEVTVQRVDLNRDGTPEWIVIYADSGHCGSAGCGFLILSGAEGAYKNLDGSDLIIGSDRDGAFLLGAHREVGFADLDYPSFNDPKTPRLTLRYDGTKYAVFTPEASGEPPSAHTPESIAPVEHGASDGRGERQRVWYIYTTDLSKKGCEQTSHGPDEFANGIRTELGREVTRENLVEAGRPVGVRVNSRGSRTSGIAYFEDRETCERQLARSRQARANALHSGRVTAGVIPEGVVDKLANAGIDLVSRGFSADGVYGGSTAAGGRGRFDLSVRTAKMYALVAICDGCSHLGLTLLRGNGSTVRHNERDGDTAMILVGDGIQSGTYSATVEMGPCSHPTCDWGVSPFLVESN